MSVELARSPMLVVECGDRCRDSGTGRQTDRRTVEQLVSDLMDKFCQWAARSVSFVSRSFSIVATRRVSIASTDTICECIHEYMSV